MNSKDPAPHITYLFGAGASFNAMPVQNELATEMHAVLSSLYALKNDNRHAASIIFIKQKLGDFIQNHSFTLKELAQEALDYQSVDTLAKVLTIQGTEQRHRLATLKECVDLFFHLHQFHRSLLTTLIKLSDTFKKKNELEYREKDREDKRYMALLASIMKTKVEHTTSLLPENISILSYNYDVCLEEALASIYEISLDEVVSRSLDSRTELFHINGIASSFNFSDGEAGLLRWNNPDQHHQGENEPSLRYAFELANGHIEHIQEFVRPTAHLVVIGYSFPVFNREIDREILKAENLKKIYIQDKEEALPAIKNRVEALLGRRSNFVPAQYAKDLGVKSDDPYEIVVPQQGVQIVLINDVDQFHIPFELI